MAGSRKKRGGDEPGVPAWMVTYGDMMSLLLCFFVLLLSFAEVNPKEFEAAAISLQQALGVLPRNLTILNVSQAPPSWRRMPRQIERMARELRKRLQVAGREEDISVQYDEKGGLRINLPSGILFDSARAELKSEAYSVLEDIAELLAEAPDVLIEICGHTDSRPLKNTTVFRDNYELSFARAMSVARRLEKVGGPPMSQYQIVALGPNEPVATNLTPEGRQANRRVEIYVRGGLTEDELKWVRQTAGKLSRAHAPGKAASAKPTTR